MKLAISARDYAVFAGQICRFQKNGHFICAKTKTAGSEFCRSHARKMEREAPAREKRLGDYLKARQLWGGSSPITYIYIARRGEDGPAKIGRSKCPEKRMQALQNASAEKINLLAQFPAPEWVEDRLHGVFKARRLEGEWFDWCAELEMLVSLIREGHMRNVMHFLILPLDGD